MQYIQYMKLRFITPRFAEFYLKFYIKTEKRYFKHSVSSIIWSYLAHFFFAQAPVQFFWKVKSSTSKKFLIFREMESSCSKIQKFLIFQEIELSGSMIKKILIFQEIEAPKKIAYISGNGTFLYFRKQKPWKTFQARKMKNTNSEKVFYISRNRTF